VRTACRVRTSVPKRQSGATGRVVESIDLGIHDGKGLRRYMSRLHAKREGGRGSKAIS